MGLRSAVAGVGYYLPERVISTADIRDRVYDTTQYEITNGLIERLTGVKTRRYRADHEQSSDLAVRAAEKAIANAGVAREDIDLLIFSACTQDITEPATANILQEKLGCERAQVVDVKNACNSFLNGLDVADSHVRAGKAKCALVCVGETLSLSIDWNVTSFEDLRSRLASLTLGDAGAAVVLQGVSEEDQRGILMTRFQSYGNKWRLATVLGGGSMHRFDQEHSYFRSDSALLREAAFEYIPTIVREVLDKVGWTNDDIDVICCHQVSAEMVNGLSEACGFTPGKEIVTVTECGNTAAASIPLSMGLANENGLFKTGTKVLLVGGAAGFSVGVVPLIW